MCLCFQYCRWVLWTANQILRILSACKFHQPLVSVTYIISSLEQCKLVGRWKSKLLTVIHEKWVNWYNFWKAQYFIIMSHKHYLKPTKVPFSMPKRVLRLTEVLFRLPVTWEYNLDQAFIDTQTTLKSGDLVLFSTFLLHNISLYMLVGRMCWHLFNDLFFQFCA